MTEAGLAHKPVLLEEIVQALNPQNHKVYVDGTFGGGGYTKALLDQAECQVVAIDQDPDAEIRAQAFKHEYGDRFQFILGRFGDLQSHLKKLNIPSIDGFVIDLGVSSFQLDDPMRGFSFRFDGPLDMRMGKTGESAADVLNNESEKNLQYILWKYGEERKSRRIAQEIVKERKSVPITRTLHLVELVKRVIPFARPGFNPATRTFQALRVHVNKELEDLESALHQALYALAPGGRIVTVAFHSLEDRIIKTFFKEHGHENAKNKYKPGVSKNPLKILNNKVIKPGTKEVRSNRRARSAHLRIAERTHVTLKGRES